MDMSNKTLALFLVAAIVVSLGGTIFSLNKLNEVGFTGRASSDTGTTNFSISSDIQITIVEANVDFGSGYVNDSSPTGAMENCTLDSEGTAETSDCAGNLASPAAGFTIRNDGNVKVNLNVSSNETASDFITGNATLRRFQWKFANDAEGTACSGVTPTVYTNITGSYITVCPATGFEFNDSKDQILLDFKLVIPQNADTGTREALITALGYQ